MNSENPPLLGFLESVTSDFSVNCAYYWPSSRLCGQGEYQVMICELCEHNIDNIAQYKIIA